MPIWQHEAKPSQGIRGLPPSPLQMTELAFIAVLNVVIPKFDNLRLPAMSPFGVCVWAQPSSEADQPNNPDRANAA